MVADRVIGIQVAASAAGAAIVPATVGVILDRSGAGSLGPCLLVLALAESAWTRSPVVRMSRGNIGAAARPSRTMPAVAYGREAAAGRRP
ncbi:hypothetical protein C6361_11620 [Plantactinospora sp. BC1]|uniref:hypothetical protein n=1 Tax=Plantactinospora sp. BC1 TaxID=2108470 RepID=UPI000D15807E|nr:hypothetical protein [Plantactinospora sp. BC1]AVT30037.1 hypothetical protein C6361_11620 [Plantactinospora sp. BC1]